MRTIVAQDLQKLFAAHQAGKVDDAEFARCKKALLEWSQCRLSLFTPRRLRVRGG